MGIYAQTDIEITCDSPKTAKKVIAMIKKLKKDHTNKDDEDFNYGYSNLIQYKESVYLSKSSGRIQNLEYQCEELWKAIKNIEGVLEMNCPFLAEADGQWFSNKK